MYEQTQLLEAVLARLSHLERTINRILEELCAMSTTAVTRDQLDAGIAALQTTFSNGVQTLQTAISDLQAKIAAGTVTTPEDFTAELNTLNGIASSFSAEVTAAQAADPGAPASPGTPSAPASGS
jgi:hypothetical protein